MKRWVRSGLWRRFVMAMPGVGCWSPDMARKWYSHPGSRPSIRTLWKAVGRLSSWTSRSGAPAGASQTRASVR